MQQRGFTLIELIIVIVILGILAVTAAPRFLNLSSDATASTLQGVKAALQSGAQLVYAKSAIAGNQTVDYAATDGPTATVGGGTVGLDNGYPAAEAASTTTVPLWVQLDLTNDFDLEAGTGSADTSSPAAGSFAIFPRDKASVQNYTAGAAGCHVLYTSAADDNSAPVISVESGAC